MADINRQARASERSGANTPEFSVSELAGAVKRTLEQTYGYVRLRGEVSGYRGPHSSGHCYFALKDEKAKIEAVIWRGVYQSLRIKPEEGMEVIATGKVTTYPGSSKYQIVIEALEPAGVGALMALLEERKKKLAAEGLFDEQRKKKLPFLPKVIGIVTSPTGAVIRDMLHGFEERFPARVLLWPVRVQGETSAAEVAAAIRGFNALPPQGPIPRPDLLIVARGGGSLEDLWGFNDEAVVRAAAASRIPLISAVGHETDWTLIDLAADARAPTPTKAAEWAVPKYSELTAELAKFADRLRVAVRRSLESQHAGLRALTRALPRLNDLLAMPRQRFDAAAVRLTRALASNTQLHGRRLARVAPRLQLRLLRSAAERCRQHFDRCVQRGAAAIARSTYQRRTRLERADGRLSHRLVAQFTERARQRLVRASDRLSNTMLRANMGRRNAFERRAQRLVPRLVVQRIERLAQQLRTQTGLLQALGYQGVLRRGFALVRDADGRAVRQAGAVGLGQALQIEWSDGRVQVEARALPEAGTPAKGSERRQSGEPRTPDGAPPARRTKGLTDGSQGSLF